MLLYLVFSRYETDGAFEMYYAGQDKAEAINRFTLASGFVFDATLKTGNVYFVCFNTASAPAKDFTFKTKSASEYDAGDIRIIIANLSNALGSSCLYTHVPFCNSTKLNPTAVICESCAEKGVTAAPAAVIRSAYGKLYCTACWNDYIHPMGGTNGGVARTDGLVEYVIGIANGTYSANAFTEEEKGYIVAVWQAKKSELTLTASEITAIEEACATKGFVIATPTA